MKAIFISIGSVLLLASFLTQQFKFDQWNGQLLQISDAGNRISAYKSSNRILEAIHKIAPEERRSEIEQLLMSNSESALDDLTEAFKALTDLSGEAGDESPSSPEIPHSRLKDRVLALEAKFEEKRRGTDGTAGIDGKKRFAHCVFTALYGIGSIFLIIGKFARSPEK